VTKPVKQREAQEMQAKAIIKKNKMTPQINERTKEMNSITLDTDALCHISLYRLRSKHLKA
jgi:hypothetical protein